MLDSLRNMGRSWIAKVLLGLLVLSVAVFGIPSIFLDLSANTVARVGDRDIGLREFERQYRNQVNLFGQQTGTYPTPEQALQLGLPGSVLNDIASQASLDMLGTRLGLGVTEDELARLVRADPNFAGTLGVFDRRMFTQVLMQSGITEAEYLDMQRETAFRQQVATALFADISAPSTAASLAHRFQGDQRAIAYVELDPLFFESVDEPDEAVLAQFFEENSANYRAEEVRNIRLVVLTPQSLAANFEVSDEIVRARYDRDIATYQTVEQRHVLQALFNTDEARAAFDAAREDGASFAEAAEAAGISGAITDFGLRPRTGFTDSSLANAAFALEEGEVTFVPGPLGERAVTVSEIQPVVTTPFEAVRDQIAAAIAVEETRDLQLPAYDAIEESRAAFQPFDVAADEFGLTVHDIALTRDGAQLAGIAELPATAIPNLIQRVFATTEDVLVTPAISLGGTSAAFFSLESIEPARDRTLDEVRAEVLADWRALEARNAMMVAAEDIVASADQGASFTAAAASTGQIPQTVGPFDRSGAGAGTLPADVINAAFAGGAGYTNHVPTQAGSVVVFQVTDARPAEGEPDEEIATVFNQSMANNLYGGLMLKLLQETELRVNQTTLNRVIGIEQ